MEEITICLKEWNAIIEALGNGIQTILIRQYKTNIPDFLLYPTVLYTKQEDFLKSFKNDYHTFVKDNLIPIEKGSRKNKQFEVKYYAKIVKIIEIPLSDIEKIDEFHIWSLEHVSSYIKSDVIKIWILRIYELNNSHFLNKPRGIMFSNVNKPINLDDLIPILSDEEFNKILKEIESLIF